MKDYNKRNLIGFFVALGIGAFVMMLYDFTHFETSTISILSWIIVNQILIINNIADIAPKEKQE